MAKEATVKKETTEVALAASGGLPTFLENEEFKQDAGKGISTSARDKQVPMMRVLQALSPQIKRNHPSYIEGAEEGMIWIRGAPVQLIRPETGFLFQPCYFTKHVVEWIPREQGGGFVTRHDFLPADQEDIKRLGARFGARPSQKNEFNYVMPNGHELVETRYHVGNVLFNTDLIIPFVMPLAGTGHGVSRQWMQQLDLHRSKTAAFGTIWRITAKPRRNVQGEWYMFDPQFLGYIDRAELPFDVDRLALYKAGKALYESMASGERELAQDEDLGSHEAGAASNANI